MKTLNTIKSTLNSVDGSEEVIGSNPIFSTERASGILEPFFDGLVPKPVPITANQRPENRFSTPFIHTGKPPLRVPRGSTKSAEIAKNKWFVEFWKHSLKTQASRYHSILN